MRRRAFPFSSDVVSSKYTYSGLSYLQFKKNIHMNWYLRCYTVYNYVIFVML